jgi:hypothetical protein
MADQASLKLMGLLFAGATFCVIVIAGITVYRSDSAGLADRPASWQAERTAVLHRT